MSYRRASEFGFTLIELILVIAIIGVIAVIAIPNLIEARKSTNQGTAIGGMKTIMAAQSLFREADREADQNFDYGTLTELSNAGILDGVIGSGSKNGYHFQCHYSTITSEFLWYAVANPAVPRGTGDLYFCTNQRGVIFYTYGATLNMNIGNCVVPNGLVPAFRH